MEINSLRQNTMLRCDAVNKLGSGKKFNVHDRINIKLNRRNPIKEYIAFLPLFSCSLPMNKLKK